MKELRKFQAFGREELESPVAEAMRKAFTFTDPKDTSECCGTCEFFSEEDEDGNSMNWCSLNDTDTTADGYCDEYARY